MACLSHAALYARTEVEKAAPVQFEGVGCTEQARWDGSSRGLEVSGSMEVDRTGLKVAGMSVREAVSTDAANWHSRSTAGVWVLDNADEILSPMSDTGVGALETGGLGPREALSMLLPVPPGLAAVIFAEETALLGSISETGLTTVGPAFEAGAVDFFAPLGGPNLTLGGAFSCSTADDFVLGEDRANGVEWVAIRGLEILIYCSSPRVSSKA